MIASLTSIYTELPSSYVLDHSGRLERTEAPIPFSAPRDLQVVKTMFDLTMITTRRSATLPSSISPRSTECPPLNSGQTPYTLRVMFLSVGRSSSIDQDEAGKRCVGSQVRPSVGHGDRGLALSFHVKMMPTQQIAHYGGQ